MAALDVLVSRICTVSFGGGLLHFTASAWFMSISVPPNGSADPWGDLKCSESMPGPPVAPETLQQMSSWHGHPMQSEAVLCCFEAVHHHHGKVVEQQPFFV